MAFYSKRSKVYHTDARCPVAKAVKKKNRIPGKGGRKMCNFCKTMGKGKKVKVKKTRKVKRAKRVKRRRRRR